MNNNIDNLITELKQEGATSKEAEELAFLAKNVSNAINIDRSLVVKHNFLNMKLTKGKFSIFKYPVIGYALALILFVSFATVVSAQDSLPGQPLYPVKRISEEIVSKVNPTFKGEILKRRSSEIKMLSNPNNANAKVLLNTIRDYEDELNEKGKINKKLIKESKNNLEDASKVATDGSKIEIEHIIRQTESREDDENHEVNDVKINISPTLVPKNPDNLENREEQDGK